MVLARLRDWFGRSPAAADATRRAALPLAEALPEGLRVYAVGDIHGHSDLLGQMGRVIEADMRRRPPERAIAVFLGDYIDRGPDSSGVLERLASADFPVEFETLRGNHEDLMLRALADPREISAWCQSGGLETLKSYGLDPARANRAKGIGKLHGELLDALPARHRSFLQGTKLCLSIGDYFFVHAGARPGVPLDRQAEEDLLWIRDECYGSDFDFGKVLVHGHTPRRRPENRPRRINVDTGAFKWGVLTCVALEGNDRRFLSSRGHPDA